MSPRFVQAARRLVRQLTSGSRSVSARAEQNPLRETGATQCIPRDWSLLDASRSAGNRHVRVRLPREAGVVSAALVLVGRSSEHELLLPMHISVAEASLVIAEDALAGFGSETLDAWIDIVDHEEETFRQRVVVAGSAGVDEPPAEAARWYATVKGNLSIEIPSRVGEAQGIARPELIEFTRRIAGVELVITAVSPSTDESEQILLLVGRERRRELVVELVEAPYGWSAIIDDDDLLLFNRDTVDVFVAGAGSRWRLSSGGVVMSSPPGALRRWHATAQGSVAIRRQTPVEAIADAGVFDAEFYRSQVPGLPVGMDPIEHYVSKGAAEGLNPSSMFDSSFYKAMIPAIRRRNPLAHYCEFGWKELRNPSPRFNTWWYWSKHLNPADESINPLAHFEAVGKQARLSTRPDQSPSRKVGQGHRFPVRQQVRRICLFAAYDPDGIVEEYVIDYVRELARFADVYYLADSPMLDSELAKLSPYTLGAWSERHGEYDFGSYSRLAERVGWATIEQYDELLLVNDSCYLLRPLDDVFARMDGRACDWWGLQATKGTYQTQERAVDQFRDPIPMASVRTTLIDGFEHDYTYDFHIGSYFLAYRVPVITDHEFRRYLASVTTQARKRNIVHKYEIGLTHWLIQHGHAFDTFVSNLYPFHPIFTRWYSRLLDEGFPLLKRFLLAENHYGVPGLANWPTWLQQRFPGIDVGVFERNLVRVTDPEKLARSLNIGTALGVEDDPVPTELLDDSEFERRGHSEPEAPGLVGLPGLRPDGSVLGQRAGGVRGGEGRSVDPQDHSDSGQRCCGRGRERGDRPAGVS